MFKFLGIAAVVVASFVGFSSVATACDYGHANVQQIIVRQPVVALDVAVPHYNTVQNVVVDDYNPVVQNVVVQRQRVNRVVVRPQRVFVQRQRVQRQRVVVQRQVVRVQKVQKVQRVRVRAGGVSVNVR